MKYLLDTNVCIRLLKGFPEKIKHIITQIPNNDLAIPSIVHYELYYGACKSNRKTETLLVLEDFLSSFQTINFDNNIAKIAGEIRAKLDSKGTPIGPYDILIAASAISHNLVLVTHNIKEFSRIDNLSLEDWEK